MAAGRAAALGGRLAGVKKELGVSFCSGKPARAIAEHGEAHGFGGGTDSIDCTSVEGGIAHDAATAHGGAFQLELGFDKQKELGAQSGEGHESREDF